MVEKYFRAMKELEDDGETKMKCFGNSMKPILQSGSLLRFKRFDNYEVGDIVFCKVRGRFIDAHKIVKKSNRGYLIANNKGFENGWTNQIYGKVIEVM